MALQQREVKKGPAETETATIAAEGTTSESIDCRGHIATHVHLDSDFEGTSLKPQVSMDDATWTDLYEEDDTDASAVTMTVAASRTYQLPTELWGAPYIRFVATEQGAESPTTLTVALS